MIKRKVAAIILSAGYSSRMGDFKPLMKVGGVTTLERVIRIFQAAGIEDTRVVIGYRFPALLNLLKSLKVRWIINLNYKKGMFSSVVAGVKSLAGEDFFIHPVDIPLVKRETILRLLESDQQGGQRILYPNFQYMRGHPPLISAYYADKIITWKGKGGLKKFLEQYEDMTEDVDVADEGILLDMDTPLDYHSIKASSKTYKIPTVRECMALMKEKFAVKNRVLRHCKEVARISLLLGIELKKAGCSIDLELIVASALLHDIARDGTNHAKFGAQILKNMGFDSVAEIVAEHMDICLQDQGPISNMEVVYLADKMAQGDQTISIEKRFEEKIDRYGNDPAARAAIEVRLKHALKVKKRFEAMIGRSLDTIFNESYKKDYENLFA